MNDLGQHGLLAQLRKQPAPEAPFILFPLNFAKGFGGDAAAASLAMATTKFNL